MARLARMTSPLGNMKAVSLATCFGLSRERSSCSTTARERRRRKCITRDRGRHHSLPCELSGPGGGAVTAAGRDGGVVEMSPGRGGVTGKGGVTPLGDVSGGAVSVESANNLLNFLV